MARNQSGRQRVRAGVLVACAIATLLSATGAAASRFVWLVFKDGSRLSVQPNWTIKPPMIVLRTAEGKLVSARLTEIDLAATSALTQATDPGAATILQSPAAGSGRPNVVEHSKKYGLKDGGTFSSLGSTRRIVPTPPSANPSKQATPELRESAAEWVRSINSVACAAEGQEHSAARRECLATTTEAFCRQAYDEKTAARESCLQGAQLQRLGKD
jgi:hypothetical protein